MFVVEASGKVVSAGRLPALSALRPTCCCCCCHLQAERLSSLGGLMGTLHSFIPIQIHYIALMLHSKK
jgi:hypothetical protein